MKTLKELYSEVLNNEELKRSFAEATKDNKVEEFLKANGCDASAEELSAFLKEQQSKAGELSDDELDNVAGGCNTWEAVASAATAGLYCVGMAIHSAYSSPDTPKTGGQVLCGDQVGGDI